VASGPSGAALANVARYASAPGGGGGGADGGAASDIGAEAKVEVKSSMPSRRAAGMYRAGTLPVLGAGTGSSPKGGAASDAAAAMAQRRSVGSAHSSVGTALRRKWAHSDAVGLGQTPLSPTDSPSPGGLHGHGGITLGMATPPVSSASKTPGTSARGSTRLPPASARPDEVISPNAPDVSPSATSGLSTEGSPPARQPDLGNSNSRGESGRSEGYRRFMSPLREDISPSYGAEPRSASYGRLPRIGIHGLGARAPKANASGITREPPLRSSASAVALGCAGAAVGARRRESSRERPTGFLPPTATDSTMRVPATARTMPRFGSDVAESEQFDVGVGGIRLPQIRPGSQARSRSNPPQPGAATATASPTGPLSPKSPPRSNSEVPPLISPMRASYGRGTAVVTDMGCSNPGSPREFEETTPSGCGTCRSGYEEESPLSHIHSQGSDGAAFKREAWVNSAAAAWSSPRRVDSDESETPWHRGGSSQESLRSAGTEDSAEVAAARRLFGGDAAAGSLKVQLPSPANKGLRRQRGNREGSSQRQYTER